MNIDKGQIIDLLRSRGENDKASEAERDLPATVDTDKDRSLLERLGLDEQAIIGALGDRFGDKLGGLGDRFGL